MQNLAIGNVGVITTDDDGALWTISTIWLADGLIEVTQDAGATFRTIDADDFWLLLDRL